jgi:cytochrome c oxidase subunit III
MATTVDKPADLERRDDHLRRASSGNGGRRDLVPAGGPLRAVNDSSPAATTGIWVGLTAIAMTFAALTSALVVRKGASTDWQQFTLPSVLYVDTLLLFGSSFTLEISRRRFTASLAGLRSGLTDAASWLWLTLVLGLLFVSGQYVAWLQLRHEGLYLSTNPSSSFFYVLTAAHALHVLGGLGGLVLVSYRLRWSRLRRSTLDIASRYWHFMDVLWLYLFLLLWVKL